MLGVNLSEQHVIVVQVGDPGDLVYLVKDWALIIVPIERRCPPHRSVSRIIDRAMVIFDDDAGGVGVWALKAFFEMKGFISVAEAARIGLAVSARRRDVPEFPRRWRCGGAAGVHAIEGGRLQCWLDNVVVPRSRRR
ncbi:hypothetical protein U1Q18_015283 [Sarracenia purpurea var. burkii]